MECTGETVQEEGSLSVLASSLSSPLQCKQLAEHAAPSARLEQCERQPGNQVPAMHSGSPGASNFLQPAPWKAPPAVLERGYLANSGEEVSSKFCQRSTTNSSLPFREPRSFLPQCDLRLSSRGDAGLVLGCSISSLGVEDIPYMFYSYLEFSSPPSRQSLIPPTPRHS